MPNPLVITLLTGILAANLLATLRSQRDPWSLRHERLAHLLLIWLLPVAGAALVFFLLRDKPEPGSGKMPTMPDPGADSMAGSGRQNARGYLSDDSPD